MKDLNANASLVGDKGDSPQAELASAPQMAMPGVKDLTHKVSANGVQSSPASWKKAGE